MVSTETSEEERPFHNGIVRGKKERLRATEYERHRVYCKLCDALVCLNPGVGLINIYRHNEFYERRLRRPAPSGLPGLATAAHPAYRQHDLCSSNACKFSEQQSSAPSQVDYIEF